MAAASLPGLGKEATCSICLEYFKYPITIECGHNFCRACLTQCWEGSEGKKVSCPQCREQVRRSLIIPARQLANIVEIAKKLPLPAERSAEGKRGGCEKHQEPLKLFCKADESPIWVVCDRSKEHKTQDYKDLLSRRLELLEEERAKIIASKAETEEESQELLTQTKAVMERTKERFRELHSFLNKQEKLLLVQLEELEKEIAGKRDKHLARLSEELSSLGVLIQEMEEKCQQPPSELLQDVKRLLKRSEKKKPFQKPLAFPPELKWKFWDVCDRNTFLLNKVKQFRDAWLLGSKIQKAYVKLDPETANECLILSKNRRSVRNEGRCHDVPSYPERFDSWPFVLGCEGFKAGRHYWEVAVEREGFWAVGVAKKSVQRKGLVELSTKKGIWAVGKWGGGYRASDLPKKSFLPLSEKLKGVRVSLNYEGGQVSFHDADTGSHLYTFFRASFSGETLLPFFGVLQKASLTVQPNVPLMDLLRLPFCRKK